MFFFIFIDSSIHFTSIFTQTSPAIIIRFNLLEAKNGARKVRSWFYITSWLVTTDISLMMLMFLDPIEYVQQQIWVGDLIDSFCLKIEHRHCKKIVRIIFVAESGRKFVHEKYQIPVWCWRIDKSHWFIFYAIATNKLMKITGAAIHFFWQIGAKKNRFDFRKLMW